jgi:hypothetical protein
MARQRDLVVSRDTEMDMREDEWVARAKSNVRDAMSNGTSTCRNELVLRTSVEYDEASDAGREYDAIYDILFPLHEQAPSIGASKIRMSSSKCKG